MKKRMLQKLILNLESIEYAYFLRGDLYRAAEIEEILNRIWRETYEGINV